jgi:hypothetical protein
VIDQVECVCGQSIILQFAHLLYSLYIVHVHRTIVGCYQFFFIRAFSEFWNVKLRHFYNAMKILQLFKYLNLTITLPGKIIFDSFGMVTTGTAEKFGNVV